MQILLKEQPIKMVEARDSEIELAAQAELACSSLNDNGVHPEHGQDSAAKSELETPEKTTVAFSEES